MVVRHLDTLMMRRNFGSNGMAVKRHPVCGPISFTEGLTERGGRRQARGGKRGNENEFGFVCHWISPSHEFASLHLTKSAGKKMLSSVCFVLSAIAKSKGHPVPPFAS